MNMGFVHRRGALLVILFATLHVTLAGEINPVLDSPIKLITPPARAMPTMTVQGGQRPVPTPSTPAAKHPQYQLGQQQRQQSESRDISNPRVRFLIGLPDTLALIEATITIDGQPFQVPRRQRIEQILKDLAANPVVKLETSPKTDSETATTVATASATVPMKTPMPASTTPNVLDRLRHTMKLTGHVPTPEEVGWLLSNWADGPTIMQLNDNFQRFRADQRPEFVVLDRNRDGTISAEEIAMSAQSFQECDLNQDGIVQFTEIAAAVNDPRNLVANIETGNLLTLLPDETSTAIPYQRLVISRRSPKEKPAVPICRFDTNGDGEIGVDEAAALLESPPDLSLSIAFDTVNPEKSRIIVVSAANDFEQSVSQATIDSAGITLMFNGTPVIVAAVQMPAGDQISVGAVNDGYPWLPKLDPNDDGRLTIRELREVPARLTTFDRNHDGALSVEEAQSPIRVCIGLGPSVHLELAGIRSSRGKDVSTPTTGPEWFVRMDRNKDNDLTRGEFPGTDEQFAALDTDGDQLVSAEEAIGFDKKTKPADDGNIPAESNVNSPNPDSASKKDSAPKEETKP